jgi:hypothetical protein
MRCTVCRHPARNQIDQALLQGARFRDLARRTGTDKSALLRHRDRHLPSLLVKAQEAAVIASADSLAAKLLAIEAEARRLGEKAEEAGDLRGALQAVRELTRLVELAARVSGELRSERVAVNVSVTPEIAARMASIFLARRERQAIDIS